MARPAQVTATFYGVRGSTPASCPANARYGANTSCVVVEVPDEPPIVFDLGTGIRLWGEAVIRDGRDPFRGTALVTHLHWDHVQGLPFFEPINRAGAALDVFAPAQDAGPLEAVFDTFMGPPFFPLRASDLEGRIRFVEVSRGDFRVGRARVVVRPVPHHGPTVGYRLEWHGVTIAYVSDHHAPADQVDIDEDVLELCRDADLLVHEAQYVTSQWDAKYHWGHCTIDYALMVAAKARARRLVLYHHDPARSDDELDALAVEARARGTKLGIAEVIAGAEGLRVDLETT